MKLAALIGRRKSAERSDVAPAAPGSWLSLGENCLPDDILKRRGLKAFSTPFSPARSNIDYVIAADISDFEGVLVPDNLRRGEVSGTPVVRSTLYDATPGLFEGSVSRGYEFTHHDVLSNEKHRVSFERKIQRWKALRDAGESANFLYHHRCVDPRHLDLLLTRIEIFATNFSRNGCACRVVVFLQELVGSAAERGFQHQQVSSRIDVVKFRTLKYWGGNNFDQFWARVDDDLIDRACALTMGDCVPVYDPGPRNRFALGSKWLSRTRQRRENAGR